jgi:hypothetical protein
MNLLVTSRELKRAERRAREAETKVRELERKCEAERVRHLAREDELVNVLVTKMGRFGLEARTVPEVEEPKLVESVTISDNDPELLALIAEGEKHGVTAEKAKERLQSEREGRVSPFDGMEFIEQ